MKLVSLDIYSETFKKNIRHVKFNDKGLSLVVDEDSTESGSSIGKTTFVRCIDLCLGSNTHKDIFKDKETGVNKEVEAELVNKKMFSILTITDGNKDIVLKRALYKTNAQYIDGKYFENINEYRDELKKILFPNAPSDLKLRKLITKFIRIGINSETIFKYQDGYGSNLEYHKAYDYFLNLYKGELIDKKKTALNELLLKKKQLNRKYHIKVEKTFKEKLIHKEKECKLREKNFFELNYIKEFEINDEHNCELIKNIDNATEEVYEIKRKINILEIRISKEKQKNFKIDSDLLKVLYEDVNENFSKLNKSFEEFVDFHNNMSNLRIKSFEKKLNELRELLETKEATLETIRKNFSNKFIEFKFDVNNKSNSIFIEYYDCKNEYEQMNNDYNMYVDIIHEIDILNKQILELDIDYKIENYRNDLNSIFEKISKEILDVKYSFVFNDNEENMPISSDNIKGKIGSGDKKNFNCCC